MKKNSHTVYGILFPSSFMKLLVDKLHDIAFRLWCCIAFLLFTPCILFAQEPKYTITDTVQGNRLMEEAKALMFNSNNGYDKSLEKLDTAGFIFEQTVGKEDTSYAKVLHQKGRCFYAKHDFDQAIAYTQMALEIRLKKLEPEHVEIANSYNNLGLAYFFKGEYDSALVYIQNALDIRLRKYGCEHLDVAISYNALGNIYGKKGDSNHAIECHQKALKIRLKKLDPEHPDVANTLHNLGIDYFDMGDYDHAIEYLRKVIEIRLKKPGFMELALAATYDVLGNIFGGKGDYDRAIEYNKKALGIRLSKLDPEHIDMAASYTNLGISYYGKIDYDRAIEYHQKSLEIRLKKLDPQHPDVASSYSNLGGAYFSKGDYDRAIEYHQKSLEIRVKKLAPEHPEVATSFNNLGLAYYSKGDYERAIDYHQKALEIRLKKIDSEHLSIATSFNNLGLAYYSKGDYERAMEYYQKSLDIRLKNLGPENPLVAESLSNFSSTYGKLNRFNEGESQIIRSLNVLNYQNVTDLSQVRSIPILIETLRAKGEFYKSWYTISPDSYRLYNSYLSFAEASTTIDWQRRHLESPGSKTDLIANALEVYEGGINACLLLYRLTDSLHYFYEAYDYAEKSKSLLLNDALRQTNALRYTGIPDSLLQREYDLRIDIAYNDKRRHDLLDAGKSETDTTVLTIDGKIFDLNGKYENLVWQFETEYPNYYSLKYDFSSINVKGIQEQLLQPGQTLLEYVVGDSSLYIFAIRKDTFGVVEIKNDFPLEKWIDTLRTSMVEQYATRASTYCRLAHQLYERLVLPVEGMLSEEIVIVPDGKLGYLPFEALLTEKPAQSGNFRSHAYLLRKHRISYCYSATLLQEMQSKQHIQSHTGTFLAFAPSFDGDTTLLANRRIDLKKPGNLLSPLIHAKEEALELNHLLGGNVVVGKDATKDAFTKQAGQFAVVHLATHGKANDQSGNYSFLAFSEIKDSIENEWLYVREIYNLNLNTDLVTLSACETGIGQLQRGEGIISLARAFSYAGAKSIVTSLWSVDDEKTKDLMVDFYRHLKKGLPKDEALWHAKLDYIEKNTNVNSHPFFWAGFIPIGDMRPISF